MANPTQTFYNTGSVILENNVSLAVITDFGCSIQSANPSGYFPESRLILMPPPGMAVIPGSDFDGTATNENEYYWFIDGKVISNYEDPFTVL